MVRVCGKCGQYFPSPDDVKEIEVVIDDTAEDATCCGEPVDPKVRECPKCGQYFPSSLELAKQASIRLEYEEKEAKYLAIMNQAFKNFLDKSYPNGHEFSLRELLEAHEEFDVKYSRFRGMECRVRFKRNICKLVHTVLHEGWEGLLKP